MADEKKRRIEQEEQRIEEEKLKEEERQKIKEERRRRREEKRRQKKLERAREKVSWILDPVCNLIHILGTKANEPADRLGRTQTSFDAKKTRSC